jgi:hypothetical protein
LFQPNPYRLIVSGRVSQFLSAFGEHVIASEVEGALAEVCASTGARVAEFTVAPVVNPATGLPHHQWLIEFDGLSGDDIIDTNNTVDSQYFASLQYNATLQRFALQLDQAMRRYNPYYNDLIAGRVLEPLHVISMPKGTFKKYLESQGKLGGQNKVVHLSDNREIADALIISSTSNKSK